MNDGQCRDYLKSPQRFGIKLGLNNIRTLLDSLDDPQTKYPSVLIAGTNGKGSVAAMLAEILIAHGFRTGLYTSPHLIRLEERIRVGNRRISPAGLCRKLSVIKEKADGLLSAGVLENPPTFFEVVTAVALAEFEQKNVDIAVLEVGMGGRFDATNVVTPIVSIITTVSKDHERYLGRKIGQIAFEKAGIIKKRVPVVCGVRRGTAYRVIRRRAKELQAPFSEVFGPGSLFDFKRGRTGTTFHYRSGSNLYSYKPSLQGLHQGENAAVVFRAAEVLSSIWKPLDKTMAVTAVENTRWEGRLERIPGKPLIVLDGAHNPAGATVLRDYIQNGLRLPVVIVFDAMRDKDIRKMGDILFPSARKVILTQIRMPRAASPEEIRGFCRAHKGKIIVEPGVEDALKRAIQEADSRTPVIVTGSLFLVGEAKKILLRKRFQAEDVPGKRPKPI